MMKIGLLTFLILLVFSSFKPGEPVGNLTCKSESGRTIFTATLPSCAYLEKAELSIDDSKFQFTDKDGEAKVFFDPENKIFTVYIESTGNDHKASKFIKFWAIPSTFKKTFTEKGEGSQFHDVYEFKGKLFATDPRKDKDVNTPTINLNCTLVYDL